MSINSANKSEKLKWGPLESNPNILNEMIVSLLSDKEEIVN